jgi:hypothetical protein
VGPIPRRPARAYSRFPALQIWESHPEAKSAEVFWSGFGAKDWSCVRAHWHTWREKT